MKKVVLFICAGYNLHNILLDMSDPWDGEFPRDYPGVINGAETVNSEQTEAKSLLAQVNKQVVEFYGYA